MSDDPCCGQGTSAVGFTEPKKPFLIADECAGQRQVPMPVKAGEVFVANQLLSLDGGELIADDSDPAKWYGFSKCEWDAAATGGTSVWIEGQFDIEQAVFATSTAATAQYRLRELGLILRQRH